MGSSLPVIVVGRQPLFRLGVSQVLKRIDGGGLVWQRSSLEELNHHPETSPGMLIVCRDLYHHFSLDALKRFKAAYPHCPILVLTEVLGVEERKLTTHGIVTRFLPMSVSGDQLADLLQTILLRQTGALTRGLTPEEEALFLPDLNDLTRRERQCLHHIQAGHSNKLIAYHFGVSENCVKHHLTSLFHKTKFRNRTDMAVAAQQLVAAFGH